MMSERALGSLGIAPVGEEEVERRDQYGSSRPLAGSETQPGSRSSPSLMPLWLRWSR